MKNLIMFCDGGSRGNPGIAGFGFQIRESESDFDLKNKDPEKDKQNSKIILEASKFLGNTTNNQAEWQGLAYGLQTILENFGKSKVKVYLDSQLVVRQIQGLYKVKKPELKPWFEKTKNIQQEIGSVEFFDIRREFNKEADKLANEAMDKEV
jgi:ribonuclease HI